MYGDWIKTWHPFYRMFQLGSCLRKGPPLLHMTDLVSWAILAAAQSLMWAVWVWRVRHPARRRMWTFLALVNFATALEVVHLTSSPPVLVLLQLCCCGKQRGAQHDRTSYLPKRRHFSSF